MKFFNKRAATAFMLALAMMSTSVAPVFAEGSRELTTVPDIIDTTNADGTDNVGKHPYRPYLDWRDRDQFGMPSKNVIYVYANAGETIYFGSNITDANDKSISAVVHEDSMLEVIKTDANGNEYSEITNGKLLDMSSTGVSGYSIAVTLPVSDGGDAYNPEKENDTVSQDDVAVFKNGSELSGYTAASTTPPESSCVYLFDVEAGGKGHISTREMENAGPNMDGTNPDGYTPLSFVAPYTGTYSFRFLSSEYGTQDDITLATGNIVYEKFTTIDFDGMFGDLQVVEDASTLHDTESKYYEPNFGYVTITHSNRPSSILALSEDLTVASGDVLKAGHKYIRQDADNGSEYGKGGIGFTPLHSGVKLEIVWKPVVEEGKTAERTIGVQHAGGSKDTSTTTTDSGVQITEITSVKGNAIEAGKELRVWIQGGEYEIYEIRYYYDRTSALEVAPEASPTPTPAPVIPDDIVWSATDDTELNEMIEQASVDGDDEDTKLDDGNSFGPYKELLYGYSSWSIVEETNTYNGVTYTKAWRAGKGNENSRCFYFTPEAKCDVTVVYKTEYKENAVREVYIKQGENSVIGNESLTSGTATSITLENVDPANGAVYVYGGSNDKSIYAIIVDYHGNDDTTSAVSAFSLYSAEVEPEPVGESYTWSFYDWPANRTSGGYKAPAIVGSLPAEGGVDYDGEYDYDLKVYGTADHDVAIWQGSMWFSKGESGYTLGNPEYGVLEMIPAWSGTVEFVFGTGTVASATMAIEQVKDGAKLNSNTSTASNGAIGGTKIDVVAGEPVYIYVNEGQPYLKSVKYTVAQGDMSDLYRTVDQPWALSESQVAAWDVTVASTKTEWNLYNSFASASNANNVITDNGLTMRFGGSGVIDVDNRENLEGEYVNAVKLDGKKGEYNNAFEYTPNVAGKIKAYAWSADTARTLTIEQNSEYNAENGERFEEAYKVKEFSLDVASGYPVYIYASRGIYFYKIEFEPTTTAENTKIMMPQNGRVWTNVLYLNAGQFRKSIYPQFDILTKEGFLYDVKLNGIQPYSFVFYSNNRGFLTDNGLLWTNKGLTNSLQSTEHSFYSFTTGSDVGDAPVYDVVDANGNPFMLDGKPMQSTILGNYDPVDESKDATHKIFFNTPDEDAVKAYTGDSSLRMIDYQNNTTEYILGSVEYTGLGSAANNDDHNCCYGTIGVGGEFTVTITQEEWNELEELGASSINITLDFSGYKLDENKAPILDETGAWEPIDAVSAAAETEDSVETWQAHNIVSLSSVINGPDTYTLSWNGKDAYGNIVPAGTYNEAIKTFAEMGMAHFPFLDAEENPNGFKLKLRNNIRSKNVGEEETVNQTADYIYYNNEAVSPATDSDDPSAWYYTGKDSNKEYPSKIGDGLNRLSGTSTAYDDTSADGAMIIAPYTTADEEATGMVDETDAGYGNYAAIDLWSKYEIQASDKFSFGVNPIEEIQPYVSFVAETTGDTELPFTVSHVGYGGTVLEAYPDNKGLETIYGNTISTGFVATIATATGATDNYVTWDITVPACASPNPEEGVYNTFIKIPTEDKENAKFMTSEMIDEQEYLAYELYSGLFEDYAIADENVIGDAYVPDWEADASLDDDGEVDMVGVSNDAVPAETAVTEEMYIESMSLLDTEGAYNHDEIAWTVTFNTDPEAILTDSTNVKVNQGDIHRVNTITSDGVEGTANIKLRYKLPTTMTGLGKVKLGIVIDNLYAPSSYAKADFVSSSYDAFHDITSTFFDTKSYEGGNTDSVQASGANNYATNPNNEYYNAVKPTIDTSKNKTIEFEAYEKGWSWLIEYYDGNNIETNVATASNEQDLGSIANGDIFYLGKYDMTNLAEIEVFAGTNEIGSSFELFAVDLTGLDVNSMTKNEINAKLTDSASFGSTGIIKDTWTTFYGHTVIGTGKSGELGLFIKCKLNPATNSGTNYVGNFDCFTLKYTN